MLQHADRPRVARTSVTNPPAPRAAVLLAGAIAVAMFACHTSADIYQWEWIDPNDHSLGRQQSETLAPDGAGVDAIPGAELRELDLTQGWFRETALLSAQFDLANLTNADMVGTYLADVTFDSAILEGVDFTGAYIRGISFLDGTRFRAVTQHGFTAEQLYSTASYQAGDLAYVWLDRNDDMRGWNFAGFDLDYTRFSDSDLTNADFSDAEAEFASLNRATLTGANFSNANFESTVFREADLTNANFHGAGLVRAHFDEAILIGADFSGANILGADFRQTTMGGFTAEQLYSTATYRGRELGSVRFYADRMIGWDLSFQNLENAQFQWCNLQSADFHQANLRNADFTFAQFVYADFSGAQLENTRLGDAGGNNDFSFASATGAGFGGGNFINSNFSHAVLVNAGFHAAKLSNCDFTEAEIVGASFSDTTRLGFTAEQLYTTASYRSGDLRGVRLNDNDLTGWDFAGFDLTDAGFEDSELSDTDFSGAFIQGAVFTDSSLTANQLYSTASYQNGDIRRILLGRLDLSGWNFEEKNLSGANFFSATLTGVNFARANLQGARDFRGSNLGAFFTGADLRDAIIGDDTPNAPGFRNTIFRSGAVHGLVLEANESMRLWDYDAETPLPIHVEDILKFVASSTLEIVVEDDYWGSTLTFEPGIEVILDGALELRVDPDEETTLASLVGKTFDLFDWSGVAPIGQFAEIAVEPGFGWDTSRLYTTGEVTLTAVPEPAAIGIALLGIHGCAVRRRRNARA